ncbi:MULTISPECIES: SRPBCC family protein [unclassified Rhodococcus (in: high G+C Gram-positive bacteria)]|uniref:SRPBCC family protein n=1 Tax=unclassified Rhodococcus (in: high G+C Gram-positive bacteria) TaxID=192944 RepID=UPI0029549262|nr:SRPBCC family protein [Rhodococcus sp. IEGM 1318]MDV8008861.1 SRPBCC family protein [Rhodococcus sp. IEGM 1318]MDZ7915659.1 SRPBCC family protein [Rhodococcus sp. (in: high G+C Gram-positive bacteria)]
MPTVEQSVEIALPPKDVWEYIAVAENWPKWENSMVECTQITEGPMGVGSRWHGVSRILGKRLEWTSEFTEYDPPRSSKSTSVESPVSFSQTMTCEEVGDGTRVTYRLDSESGLGGVFGKMADPIVTKAFSRTVRVSLENLADILVHAE